MNEPNQELEYTGDVKYQPTPLPLGQKGKRVYPYKPEPGVVKAVNLAIALDRPLLLEGEPGCGKTRLARAIADEFTQRYLQGEKSWPYFPWNIKSTSRAQDGLYTYDAIARLRDAQFLGMNNLEKYLDDEAEIDNLITRLKNRTKYLEWGPLGKAFNEKTNRPILLIDEIDKADIDFPNDLLLELEELRFDVTEIGRVGENGIKAEFPPIVIITSNRERDLPEAFLRRCIYYFLNFPDEDELIEIVNLHFPNLEPQKLEVIEQAVDKLLDLRDRSLPTGKKPGTSELLDALRILLNKPVSEAFEDLTNLASNLPILGTFLKKKEDQDHYQEESDE